MVRSRPRDERFERNPSANSYRWREPPLYRSARTIPDDQAERLIIPLQLQRAPPHSIVQGPSSVGKREL